MPPVTKSQLQVLDPWLENEDPNETGEIGMKCPFHDDSVRSASLNVVSGVWFCHACDRGGNIKQLLDGVAMIEGGMPRASAEKSSAPSVSEDQVRKWAADLLADDELVQQVMTRRGLSMDSLLRFQIGYDHRQRAYTIPIRDFDNVIRNVRSYQFDAPDDRRKIWSIAGMGTPMLYPIDQLEHDEIIICEGEWDAMITIQNGFAAITRTGAADVWKSAWSNDFMNKTVWVCHDMDAKGQKANDKIADGLRDFASHVETIKLPYDVTEKHGKDLTDFWADGHTPLDLSMLMSREAPIQSDHSDIPLLDVSVLDSFDSKWSGKEMRMRVTITGKRNPSFLVPSEIDYSCTQDAGLKCNFCPMNDLGGTANRKVDRRDPQIMEMMGATKSQLSEVMRTLVGAQKCGSLVADVTEHMSVEELYVRPSIDRADSQGGGDYTNRKIVSVGRHDSLPNNTVELVGTIYPNPRGQQNEFQAWELAKTETSIDRFTVTQNSLSLMKVFQPSPGQDPIDKLMEIAQDLEVHVTRIYGRPLMHALFDLVWHSVHSFDFNGVRQQKGWLEALVVGDTRTGKSEVAGKLIEHYNAGEMISCESATFAGIVGGLQQFGSGKEWEVSWGAVPLNDRRLVVLDEVSGLTTEQISQMSSIRSSGEAQLTKIRSEKAWARTRLIWLGNPRDGRLADYTYGIYAIPPLIGNNEDVARFDLAMSVAADEVQLLEINRKHSESDEAEYDIEEFRELVLWAWSRKPEQVVWEDGSESAVFKAANDLGKRYVETPPLIQGANVRIKIARTAVALATRLFSTDDTHELVVVRPEHVRDAVKFIDMLYEHGGFGYAEHSREVIRDIEEGAKQYDRAKAYVVGNGNLSKFLRGTRGSFRRQDLEDVMGIDSMEARATIKTLWDMRMISRQGADIKVLPLLHQILREVRDR